MKTETIKYLDKVNRVRVTAKDRRILKAGLAARMKTRERKVIERQKEYMK